MMCPKNRVLRRCQKSRAETSMNAVARNMPALRTVVAFESVRDFESAARTPLMAA